MLIFRVGFISVATRPGYVSGYQNCSHRSDNKMQCFWFARIGFVVSFFLFLLSLHLVLSVCGGPCIGQKSCCNNFVLFSCGFRGMRQLLFFLVVYTRTGSHREPRRAAGQKLREGRARCHEIVRIDSVQSERKRGVRANGLYTCSKQWVSPHSGRLIDKSVGFPECPLRTGNESRSQCVLLRRDFRF